MQTRFPPRGLDRADFAAIKFVTVTLVITTTCALVAQSSGDAAIRPIVGDGILLLFLVSMVFDEERLFCGLQPFAYIAGLAGLMDLLYLIFEFQYYGVSGIAAWPWPVLLGESSVLVACLVKFYGAAKGWRMFKRMSFQIPVGDGILIQRGDHAQPPSGGPPRANNNFAAFGGAGNRLG